MNLARAAYRGGAHLARIEGENAVLLAEESSHPEADVLQVERMGELTNPARGR